LLCHKHTNYCRHYQTTPAAAPYFRAFKQPFTPYDLIDKNRAGKKIKKGYVWTLFGDALAPYVYFQFQADRTGETAQKLIKGFSGFLVTDGYGGYDWYRADRSANCNVHSRRYFEKALKCDKKKAGAILALYSKLYKIEETLKGKSEEEILLVRHEQSLPIMNQMHTLLQSWRLTEPPKTSLGVAINYALSRWDQLVLFTKHAVIPMDTNLVENAIRAIAIGRKNWLKISGEGGLRTATVHATGQHVQAAGNKSIPLFARCSHPARSGKGSN